MKIHEYQAKEILKQHNVPVPVGFMADTIEKATEVAKDIKEICNADTWAVKAQIHAGGRGKGGGIKIAKNLDEVKTFASDILGMQLITKQTSSEGKKVSKLLIEQGIYYKGEYSIEEYYMSIILNRKTGKNIIIYSTEGGVDIEDVAENSPELIFKEEIDPKLGLQDFQLRKIAFNINPEGNAYKEIINFTKNLYIAYINTDASLFEINPVIKTSDNKILAADAKVTLEENSFYRHPEHKELRDITEEDPVEIEASEYNLNYIKLKGNVGCMVNGAGLAMATMDIIKLSGGSPANFLDVGGNASAETVEKGFKIILKDKNVKAIFINIFGGIVRCDRVANGIVEAYNNLGNISVPLIVRLQGTNAKLAKIIIDNSGLKVHSTIFLHESAEKIKKVLG